MSEKKNVLTEEVKEVNENKELSLEDLDDVSGGAFGNVPRVPTKNIDDRLRERT